MEDVNQTVLVARLTKDPEMKGSVLPLRLAFTTRQKNGEAWEDKPNYIDAVVFGRSAEALYPLLSKGTRVVVAGNLEWREWISDGQTRSTVQVIARNVQIVDAKRDNAAGGGSLPDDIPFAPSVA